MIATNFLNYREKEAYEKPTTKRQKKKAAAANREKKRQQKLAENPLSMK